MAAIKGQNLRIFLDGIALAAARECDLNIRLEVQPMSTKDDESDFSQQMVTRLSWEVRSSGVVTNDLDRNDVSDLEDLIGEEVDVEFGTAGGELNSVLQDSLLAGRAILTDIQVAATAHELSVYSVVLTGQYDLLFPLAVLVSSDSKRFVTSDNRVLLVVDDSE